MIYTISIMKKINRFTLLFICTFVLLIGGLLLTSTAAGGGVLDFDNSQEETTTPPGEDNTDAGMSGTFYGYTMLRDPDSGAIKVNHWGSNYGIALIPWSSSVNMDSIPSSFHTSSSSYSTSVSLQNNTARIWARMPSKAGYSYYGIAIGYINNYNSSISTRTFYDSSFIGYIVNNTISTNYHYSGSNEWLGDIPGGWDAIAVMQTNKYNISYSNLQGATCSGPTSATYDKAVYIPNPSTRTGYTFAGWTFNGSTSYAKYGTSSSSVTTSWTSTSTKVTSTYFKNLITTNNGTVTMKANWTANKYTVTLNSNKGSGSSTPTGGTSSVSATYNSAMPSATMPTRDGYTFEGYYDTSASTGGTQYYTSTGASARVWNKTSNATLYARWTPITYALSYDLNGGSYGTYHPASATYDSVVQISNPIKTGYAFAGWSVPNGTALDLSTAKYGNSSSSVNTSWTSLSTKPTAIYYKNLASTSGGDVFFQAQWRDASAPVIHRKTWVQNGSTGYYVYAYVTDNIGVARVQFPTWTDKNGQDDIQANWGTNSAASGTSGNWTINNQTYNYRYTVNVTEHNNEYGIYNTHIYAYDAAGNSVSTAIGGIRFNFTVTLNSNGGIGGSTSIIATYDAAMPNLTSLPTREGWKFLGYYDAQTGGTQYYTSTGASARAWNKASNTTLFAQWQEKTWIEDSSYYSTSLSGQGTETNPYKITSAKDLAYLAKQSQTNNFSGKYFRQTSNIDLSAHLWTSISDVNDYINSFAGIYDGGLYSVRNLRMNGVASGHYGLFYYTKNAMIKNINLQDIEIQGEKSASIGGIVSVPETTTIQNCVVTTAKIIGRNQIGGIVGVAFDSTISQCMVKDCTITGQQYIGGILGDSFTTSITDCNVMDVTIICDSGSIICDSASVQGDVTINSSYGSGTLNGTATKVMYGDTTAWGNWSLVEGVNGGLPVQKGLYHIGGFTDSKKVYDHLVAWKNS